MSDFRSLAAQQHGKELSNPLINKKENRKGEGFMVKQMVLFILLFAFQSLMGQNGDDIIGLWASNEVNVRIEVFKEGNTYKGKIVYLKDPKDSSGKPKTDVKNHDPKLRNRPLMGLVILENLKFENGEWAHGKIYDPETGGYYKCYVTMKNKNELHIRAYMGFSLFGKTIDWYRLK
jgi:uncharacterized protein (DUF2147 family)